MTENKLSLINGWGNGSNFDIFLSSDQCLNISPFFVKIIVF